MPSAVASRPRSQAKKPTAAASRDSRPPAKKTKLSQPAPEPQSNGLNALLNGTTDQKSPLTANVNGIKNPRKERIEDATVVVGGVGDSGDVDMVDSGKSVIEISSAEEESDYSNSDEEEKNEDQTEPLTNGHVEEDQPMEDGTAELEEPTFGERLQAHRREPTQAPNVVDVEKAFVGANAESRALAAASNNRPLSAPNASSLGTVLTQALRTNDQDLLESCLRVIDVDTIYATVERLPSPLVGTLLQKLAERLHKRPGRAGILMIWVQWSLAAHGGYLASQPQLVKQLATLNKVLKERASGLQPLLSLKGRLDMLHAQLELRRRNQKRAAQDEEEEAVIYVEGEDDSSSEEEDHLAIDSEGERIRQRSKEDGQSSDDDMPTTAAFHESDDVDSEGSEGLLDDEAEETDIDTGDDMSEPLSDDEVEEEEASESEEESRPARRSTVGRTGASRRY